MTFLIIAALLSSGEFGVPKPPDSTLIDTVTVSGTFAGFSLGDYYHAVILLESGEMVTAWAPRSNTPGLDIFLFQHRWDLVDVTVVDIPSDIPEAGELFLPTVVDAFSEGSYTDWYLQVSEEFGIETQQQFIEHFGDPAIDEPLFDEWAYVNGSADGLQ